MNKETERLYKNLWTTRGARLIAAKRLEYHDNLSNLSIVLASAYVICLNLIIILPKKDQVFTAEETSFITICLSILILATSQLVSSKNFKIRARDHHNCGKEIKKIYDNITYWKDTNYTPKKHEIEYIQKMYTDVLDQYENHKTTDFFMFKANNMAEYAIKNQDRFYIIANIRFYKNYLIYLIIVVSPLLLFIKNSSLTTNEKINNQKVNNISYTHPISKNTSISFPKIDLQKI